jgi:arginyl-tRNA synthetase
LSQSRLYLISAVMNVLAISLNLLGVSAPDKM